MMKGFASIGLVRPKNKHNIGGVLRAAHCYDAKLVVIEGDRSSVKSNEDTTKAWRHIPVLRINQLFDACPYDAVPIGIDLVEGATPLSEFKHPVRAFYIFGPEDGTLGKAHLDKCAARVFVPTKYCMNLAATVNVVLYDRLAKGKA